MSYIERRTDWDALAALHDEDIPLLWASLLIARDEYPELDMGSYELLCSTFETELTPKIDGLEQPHEKLAAINRYLYEEQGFSGNADDYYDPRNSYLNDVLDRKLGIPISLGVIQIELARRLGVPLEGVSFPGHFLVRLPVDGGLIVLDPFYKGRSVDAEELRMRARPHLGGGDLDDAQLLKILAPASHRNILMRMLRNLKALYSEQEVWDKAVRCADRLVKLDPRQIEEVRDRGLLYVKLGHYSGAREDLTRYVTQCPQAEDHELVRLALLDANSAGVAVN